MPLIFALVLGLSVQAPQASESTGRVAGRVTAETTHAPIVGARIILLPAPVARPSGPPGPPPQALTDQDGGFTFEHVAPGMYRIDAQKTGFAPLADPGSNRTFIVGGVTAGSYRLNASIPIVIGAGSGGVSTWTSNVTGGMIVGGAVSGTSAVGGNVSQPIEITVSDRDVSEVRVVVHRPAPQ